MSVPQSERRQSQQEYVTLLQQIEVYFIDKLEDKNTYVYGLSEKLVSLSIEAYNNATCYFEMTIGTVHGSLAEKKKFCKKTIWSARELASQINILIIYRMRRKRSTNELVIKTQELLKVVTLLKEQLNKLNKNNE